MTTRSTAAARLAVVLGLLLSTSATAARAETAAAVVEARVFSAAYATKAPEATRFWPAPRLADMPAVHGTLKSRAFSQNSRAAAQGTLGRLTPDGLYRRIPFGVRLAGEQDTLRYLQNRHVSHIRAVKTSPWLATSPRNIVFEPAPWNGARGARDMSLAGRARVMASNTAASTRGIGSTAARGFRTYWPALRSTAAAASSPLVGAFRTGTLAPRALAAVASTGAPAPSALGTLRGVGATTRAVATTFNPAVGVADTTLRWAHQVWTNSVRQAAGTQVLKGAAAGAVAGGAMAVTTELVVGGVRVANCPAGQEGTCGAAAVAAESAAPIAVAAVAGAAVGAVVKAAALTGVTVSAPVSTVLLAAGATGYLVYTGMRVWNEMTPEQKARITDSAAATWNATKAWSQQTVMALRFW